ncbi:MAG: redoxin domain-containing protein [Chitinophagales bacterium]|nr:redoxin domain-containing protein [Chitinophagales bacterium]MDW8428468.1 redoxin domain-containing protein [Chitinophagales bacterium]
MALSIGQPAPDFTLYSSEKQPVSLTDFRGKNVVLLFFPFVYSSVCTKELCTVQETFGAYEQFGAQVLGISVDPLFAAARFRQEYNIRFPLLSDFNKEVTRRYDVLLDEFAFGYRGVARRATFVVDKSGILRYAEVLGSPGDFPDLNRLADALAQLQDE